MAHACANNHVACLTTLISQGATGLSTPDAKDHVRPYTKRELVHTWWVWCDQGKTPAHKACEGGHSACVKVLAEHKADLNTPDENVPSAPLLRVCCVFCARASMMRVV